MRIEVEDLHKSFSDYPALRGVNLCVEDGELLALLGPSGSGKTTLLRVIAGLDYPERGRILFNGRDVAGVPVQKRGVGFVFQHYALFRHMRVWKNVAFGLEARPLFQRPSRAERHARAMELLDLVQLGGLGNRFPGQLSGGQRQRVALARALAIDPAALFLDEPFGALDAKVRRELRRWLRDLHDRTGHTTLFVTHDQEEALELADRVVVMRDGQIEQIGTPEEIFLRPATGFVYGFLGETNALDVQVSGGRVFHDGLEAPLLEGAARPDGPARLFVRPAEVLLEPVRETGAPASGPVARVTQVRRRLESLHLDLVLEATGASLEATIGGADPAGQPTPGDRMTVRIGECRLYDPETGSPPRVEKK
ncbi:sulfate ABC transporter ATP-binding protein [Phaeovibrio sulfidiphilus]|uniref:Sulfate ABC transporter ATP-binding protein n=1 Tax=Phaeovibrio sulfidiphilus TaxID=1220600 RepID=A0A8J6YMH8_9PROT|nr:sulfate ABC transporter ATP-binding protein [Phaeovibrio sulfidiphilus]MBE1237453.1 sulfate ABC transporter ATP-binding protein [Phaeovibrio sulfidiphilus]